MTERKPWTDAEKLIVREIFASIKTIPEQAYRLPDRNTKTIAMMGNLLGLEKAKPVPLRIQVAAAMRDGEARSAEEIAVQLKAKKKFVRDILAEMVKAGTAHIESFDGPYNQMLFKSGAGTNATRPPPTTQKQYRQRRLAKMLRSGTDIDGIDDRTLDDAYRPRDSSWPYADDLVVRSMRAMVQVGRAGA